MIWLFWHNLKLRLLEYRRRPLYDYPQYIIRRMGRLSRLERKTHE